MKNVNIKEGILFFCIFPILLHKKKVSEKNWSCILLCGLSFGFGVLHITENMLRSELIDENFVDILVPLSFNDLEEIRFLG